VKVYDAVSFEESFIDELEQQPHAVRERPFAAGNGQDEKRRNQDFVASR
jgi:hypothetical protein